MNASLTSPALPLTGYCLLAFLAALLGGVLPSLFKLTHARLQVAISFVAGLMLGLSLLGLLPHASHQLNSTRLGMAWLLGGFLVMFFLQRFLPFHHHDVAEGSPVEPCGHAHSLAERSARKLNWVGVALGLSLHSVFDGVALAAAVASVENGQGGTLALGTALAVILHKPFGAGHHHAHGRRRFHAPGPVCRQRRVRPGDAGGRAAVLCRRRRIHPHIRGGAGGRAGVLRRTFLCIACADLLPELQFHRHDRIKLSVALLLGVAAAWLIITFGHAGREHGGAHTVRMDQPILVL